MSKTTQILTMDVDNEFGVLTRITALIRREGLNIKGLSVAETVSCQVSRLTVVVEMQGIELQTILSRIGRLDCVHTISVYEPAAALKRELALVLCLRESGLWKGERVLWDNGRVVCFELTGTPEELNDYVARSRERGLIALSRSGAVTIEKGVRDDD